MCIFLACTVLYLCVYFVVCVFWVFLCSFSSVLWYCWLGLLTCKNRLPYKLYCVRGDIKHCSIQSNPSPQPGQLKVRWPRTLHLALILTLWRPLLPYGYSYKASCAGPGCRAECQSARMSKIAQDALLLYPYGINGHQMVKLVSK